MVLAKHEIEYWAFVKEHFFKHIPFFMIPIEETNSVKNLLNCGSEIKKGVDGDFRGRNRQYFVKKWFWKSTVHTNGLIRMLNTTHDGKIKNASEKEVGQLGPCWETSDGEFGEKNWTGLSRKISSGFLAIGVLNLRKHKHYCISKRSRKDNCRFRSWLEKQRR